MMIKIILMVFTAGCVMSQSTTDDAELPLYNYLKLHLAEFNQQHEQMVHVLSLLDSQQQQLSELKQQIAQVLQHLPGGQLQQLETLERQHHEMVQVQSRQVDNQQQQFTELKQEQQNMTQLLTGLLSGQQQQVERLDEQFTQLINRFSDRQHQQLQTIEQQNQEMQRRQLDSQQQHQSEHQNMTQLLSGLFSGQQQQVTELKQQMTQLLSRVPNDQPQQLQTLEQEHQEMIQVQSRQHNSQQQQLLELKQEHHQMTQIFSGLLARQQQKVENLEQLMTQLLSSLTDQQQQVSELKQEQQNMTQQLSGLLSGQQQQTVRLEQQMTQLISHVPDDHQQQIQTLQQQHLEMVQVHSRQINKLEELQTTLTNRPHVAHCLIEVLAYSANNFGITRSGYVNLNANPVWQAAWAGRFPNLRGVTVIAIEPFECSAEQSLRFDTYDNVNASTELNSYLQEVSRGTIIVGVSADEPRRYLANVLPTLTEMGADVTDVQIRGAFAFVAQKGFPAKTVLRKALTPEESNANQPQFNATITGATCCIQAAQQIIVDSSQ